MTNNEEKLIGVIKTLCDACPYGEYEEQCEAYNFIDDIKAGGADAEH